MNTNLTQKQIDLIQILIVAANMRYHVDETCPGFVVAGNEVDEEGLAELTTDLDTAIYAVAQRLASGLPQDPVSEIAERWVERRARLGLGSPPWYIDKAPKLAPLREWPSSQPTN
jgi:hypothetical protein